MNKYLESLSGISKILNINISPLVKVYNEEVKRLFKHHGKEFTTKRLKDYLTICERFALHQTIEPLPFTKSDSEGFPNKLSAFKPYLRGNQYAAVMGLSILRYVEDLRLPISKDISTVTEPCVPNTAKFQGLPIYIEDWVKIRLKPSFALPNMVYHTTFKSGPNGQALETSDKDLAAVKDDQELWSALQSISSHNMDEYPPDDDFKTNSDNKGHSRLTQFPEKSGKTRTIGVIDYWSQRALKPLHKCLMKSLRQLKSDGTYSHDNVGEYAKQKTQDKSFVFCADLSAATDRLPRSLSYSVLKGLFPDKPELLQSYWTVLTDRTFRLSWSGETVKYGCGQPMGAYASWPLFALTHHAIAIYCGRHLKGVEDYYRMIGDDIIITDERMSKNYINLMEYLGMTINYNKTVTSPSESVKSCAEVAKQLFLNGVTLTPMTPGLIRNLKKPTLALQTLKVLINRYTLPEHFPTTIMKIFYAERPKIYDMVFCICSNPISGLILKKGIKHKVWTENSLTAVTKMYWFVRAKSLKSKSDKAIEAYNKIVEYFDDFDRGHCSESETTTERYNDAQRHASDELVEEYQIALEDLYLKAKDGSAELIDIEYMFDPSNPFRDTKDKRAYLNKSLLLETAAKLTNDDKVNVDKSLKDLFSKFVFPFEGYEQTRLGDRSTKNW